MRRNLPRRWSFLLRRIKKVEPRIEGLEKASSHHKKKDPRDWVIVCATIAMAVAAGFTAYFNWGLRDATQSIASVEERLTQVSERLADLQEREILNRAKARLEIINAKHYFFPRIPARLGEWLAFVAFRLKNTSTWDASNPYIEWRHWVGDKEWQPRIPKGGPCKIDILIIERTGEMIGVPCTIRISLEEKYKMTSILKPGQSIGKILISSDTAANPEGIVLEEGKHLPFGIRISWTGPQGKIEKKVQYVNIHRETSPVSAKEGHYITTDILDEPPENIPNAFP